MGWSLIATDRRGTPLGELRQVEGRGWRKSLNRGRSVRGTIRATNGLAGNIQQGDCTFVKAYDDRTGAEVLRHFGPVSNSNKSVDERGNGKIQWTSNGLEWRLLARLIGKTVQGASFGTSLALVDRGAVMQQIINALNRGDAASIWTTKDDTGIRAATADITPSVQGYFGPWQWYPAASAFAALSAGLDGTDYDIVPTEPTPDADGIQMGRLVAAPAIGQLRLNAAFEYGAGRRNVKTFQIVTDSGAIANDVAHLPTGDNNTVQSPIEKTDPESIAARGLHEAALTDPVLTDTLRTTLVQDHLNIRKVPRRVIDFAVIRDPDPISTPLEERRVPRPFIDYDVGDIVPFRATELVEVIDAAGKVTGYVETKTVDALFRIFTMDISIGDDGSEEIALTFVEEG